MQHDKSDRTWFGDGRTGGGVHRHDRGPKIQDRRPKAQGRDRRSRIEVYSPRGLRAMGLSAADPRSRGANTRCQRVSKGRSEGRYPRSWRTRTRQCWCASSPAATQRDPLPAPPTCSALSARQRRRLARSPRPSRQRRLAPPTRSRPTSPDGSPPRRRRWLAAQPKTGSAPDRDLEQSPTLRR